MRFLSLAILALASLPATAQAQDAPAPTLDGAKTDSPARQRALKRFDTNKDGRLDESERKAARKAISKAKGDERGKKSKDRKDIRKKGKAPKKKDARRGQDPKRKQTKKGPAAKKRRAKRGPTPKRRQVRRGAGRR